MRLQSGSVKQLTLRASCQLNDRHRLDSYTHACTALHMGSAPVKPQTSCETAALRSLITRPVQQKQPPCGVEAMSPLIEPSLAYLHAQPKVPVLAGVRAY